MNKKTRGVTLAITGFLLFFSMLVYLLPPEAEASEESRINKASGHGFFSLAQRWNNKHVRKNQGQKFESQKEVVGYYTRDWVTDDLSQNSLKSNSRKISSVATFSYNVTSSGKIIGDTPKKALNTAWANNIETLALVHNLSSKGFDGKLIHSILTNPALRTETISNIYKILIINGFDGVNIDFEHVPTGDRQALNEFMSELKKKLEPDGLKVTISVPAKTWDDPRNGWSGAFDYKHLGQVADRVMLMTYDEHWIGGSPGPVASKPWVEKVLKYSTQVIPNDKILLGIGAYGYDWIVGKGGHKTVLSKNAVALAQKNGATISWDNEKQTPYFYYWQNGKKHVVWFESTQSAGAKVDLVNKYNLKGIAVWRLGFEAWDFWNMVQKKFN